MSDSQILTRAWRKKSWKNLRGSSCTEEIKRKIALHEQMRTVSTPVFTNSNYLRCGDRHIPDDWSLPSMYPPTLIPELTTSLRLYQNLLEALIRPVGPRPQVRNYILPNIAKTIEPEPLSQIWEDMRLGKVTEFPSPRTLVWWDSE